MTDQAPPSTTIQKAESASLAQVGSFQAWQDPDWQRLWLTLDRAPWRALALIPAGEGGASDLTLTMAVMLSRTGMSHVGAPILVADGRQVPLDQLNRFLGDVRTCCDGGERVIIALSSAAENATTVAIAKAADAAVLCVLMNRMRDRDARSTIKLVGAGKFLGSVIIRPDITTPATP